MNIYKLANDAEWQQTLQTGRFPGAPIDLRDGYLHFSTAEQALGTYQKYFADIDPVWLLEVDAASFGDALRFEVSRGGMAFPHVYGTLDRRMVLKASCLHLDQAVQILRDLVTPAE